MDIELARNFLIALAIGALVGIEREKKKGEPGHSFGGIRTHILVALAGASAAWLSREFDVPWVFPITLAVVGAAVLSSYVFESRERDEALGLTSEIAAIVVCLLGGMAVTGNAELAAALGVATSAVLAFKKPLHGLVERIGFEDLYAGIKLLIASFIVLPLLPDAPIDPWEAINPYKLWLLVILISALSMVGYVAVRWLGTTHGNAITGVAGALVSSTAATLSLVRTSRVQSDDAHARALAAAILLAWFVMFARMAVVLAIVNRALLHDTWLPLAAMGAVTLAFAAWHYRAGLSADSGRTADDRVGVRNPFSLGSAMRFGALFAVVLLVVKLAQQYAPGVGVYVVSALAGSVDVDAIVLSLAGSAGDASARATAGTAIAIVALSNTAVKCAMVVGLGSGSVRRNVVMATVGILAAGLAAIWLA